MQLATIKKMQKEFVGKICSVLTSSIARSFNERQFSDFFVVIINEITEDGIFAKHPVSNCVSFYSWHHIIGVFEEQVVDDSNPEYDNILAEVKPMPAPENLYIDPETMADLAKQAQKMLRKN